MYLVSNKEAYRISGFNNSLAAKREINDESDKNEIKRLLNLYRYWGDKDYLIIYSKEKDYEGDLNEDMSLRLISSSLSNKRSSKRLNVYEIRKNNNTDHMAFNKENIVNGDMKLIEPQNITRSKLQKWIKNGLTFYNDNTIMPAHDYLLPLWSTPPRTNYPMVQLATDNPIGGSNSLYVRLNDNNTIYLLNKVSPDSGILSFKITCISNDSTIYLMRYEYLNDKLNISDDAAYALLIQKKQNNYFSIPYDACKTADSALFCINGSNAEFYINDISFMTKGDTEQPSEKENVKRSNNYN